MAIIGTDGKVKQFPKPKLKRRKAAKPSGPSEASIQAGVEQYLNIHGVPYIRLPDALMRGIFASNHIPIHQKTIISSYLKGLPDIMAIKRDGKYCSMLPLELKKKGGKLSQGQKTWQKKLGTVVAYSLLEAIQEINEFLGTKAHGTEKT